MRDADDAVARHLEVECRARALDETQKESKGDLKAGVADPRAPRRDIGGAPGAGEHREQQASDRGQGGNQVYDGRDSRGGSDQAPDDAERQFFDDSAAVDCATM